ncbi:MAG: hypothetical protein R2855_13950 [Thermomicrobiales bacterium]
MHLRTLLAVFTYFWRELVDIFRAIPTMLHKNVSLLKGPEPGESGQRALIVRRSMPGSAF